MTHEIRQAAHELPDPRKQRVDVSLTMLGVTFTCRVKQQGPPWGKGWYCETTLQLTEDEVKGLERIPPPLGKAPAFEPFIMQMITPSEQMITPSGGAPPCVSVQVKEPKNESGQITIEAWFGFRPEEHIAEEKSTA